MIKTKAVFVVGAVVVLSGLFCPTLSQAQTNPPQITPPPTATTERTSTPNCPTAHNYAGCATGGCLTSNIYNDHPDYVDLKKFQANVSSSGCTGLFTGCKNDVSAICALENFYLDCNKSTASYGSEFVKTNACAGYVSW